MSKTYNGEPITFPFEENGLIRPAVGKLYGSGKLKIQFDERLTEPLATIRTSDDPSDWAKNGGAIQGREILLSSSDIKRLEEDGHGGYRLSGETPLVAKNLTEKEEKK